MAERNRSVLEDDEIDRVRPQPPARIGEQGEPLLPAGVGAQSLAKRHGEIDVGPWSGLGSRSRSEEVDCGKVGVTAPGTREGGDSIIEVVGQWTFREHAAIVMRAGIGRSEKQRSPWRTAGNIAGSTCGGTWVITPDELKGRERVKFLGT